MCVCSDVFGLWFSFLLNETKCANIGKHAPCWRVDDLFGSLGSPECVQLKTHNRRGVAAAPSPRPALPNGMGPEEATMHQNT